MKRLWIVGAGGHGVVVADAARASQCWSEIAFFDDRWPGVLRTSVVIEGTVAAASERLLTSERHQVEVIVAVGDNSTRLTLSSALQAIGANLATVVHPFTAISPSVQIGAGSVVLAGAVINAGATLGRACIVNTRASVDHDCVIGDGVHISPGVALAGNVVVHDLCWLGIGSCAIPGVVVGRAAVVGAGAAVTKNVNAGTTVAGCPAKEIRSVSQ